MRRPRTKRTAAVIVALLVVIYLFLLIPDRSDVEFLSMTAEGEKHAFAWNMEAYWDVLEEKYRELRQAGCGDISAVVRERLDGLREHLAHIDSGEYSPEADDFFILERQMFETAPFISACSIGLEEFLPLVVDTRAVVKRQSIKWDMQNDAARTTLYRLLYGSRSVLEELMMQVPEGTFPALIRGHDEPSATPSAVVKDVRMHSGDILVSRGGAPTSALIARGNDFPGNFSHIAFVHVDPASHEASIVEAHIEIGVVVSTVEQYLKDKKLRVMLLRPRFDLEQIAEDPMLPHKAAEYAYKKASAGHVPYDFAMNYRDHAKLFCSEVASEAYAKYGVNLWSGISHISSPGLRRWLAAFGVRHFETQEPSDLEYDPQLRVVAEWRDPDTLKKDRFDNAVTEVMLEGAEKGDMLGYQRSLLPLSRLVKLYSMVLNLANRTGVIPEGMSATTALRIEEYSMKHEAIKKGLVDKAEQFRQEKGYETPYWELVKLAREAKQERGEDS